MCDPHYIPDYQLEITQIIRIDQIKVLFNDPQKPPTCKNIYKGLLDREYDLQNFKHTCVNSWCFRYKNLYIDWSRLWDLSFQSFCPNIKEQVTWLLRHFAHYTAEKVTQQHPNVFPPCKSCPEQSYETLLHAFSECIEVKPIWEWAQQYFTPILGSRYRDH